MTAPMPIRLVRRVMSCVPDSWIKRYMNKAGCSRSKGYRILGILSSASGAVGVKPIKHHYRSGRRDFGGTGTMFFGADHGLGACSASGDCNGAEPHDIRRPEHTKHKIWARTREGSDAPFPKWKHLRGVELGMPSHDSHQHARLGQLLTYPLGVVLQNFMETSAKKRTKV